MEQTLTAERSRGQAPPVASPRAAGDIASRVSTVRVAVVVTVCLAYALIHLATIVRSRQVWFDETFFASVADSLVRTGELDLLISPLWLPGHVYLYGPVHFLMLGSLFELFGIGIVQNRLPALLFGFALLGMTWAILRHEGARRSIALFTCVLLALDPTFHQSVHSGRMDSTALFFILAGLFCLLKSRDADGRSGLWWCVASGVASALGVLTTPRPGYMLIPIGLILLARWYRRRDTYAVAQAFLWGAAFAGVYAMWVAYAFGSVGGMLSYYGRFAETYAGASQVRLVHVPLLATICALLAVVLVRRPRRAFSELTVFALWSVVAFYIFVKSAPSFGALYAFLMIPPAYLALGKLMAECGQLQLSQRTMRLTQYGAFGLLLSANGAAFLARSALELAEWERRDPAAAEEIIGAVIPKGSNVVGDDQFYFAVRRNDSEFQYLERGGTLEERVAYHRDVFRFDYLITNQSEESATVRAYLEAVPMRKVGQIGVPPTSPLAEMIVGAGRWLGLSNSLRSGYDGQILARVR